MPTSWFCNELGIITAVLRRGTCRTATLCRALNLSEADCSRVRLVCTDVRNLQKNMDRKASILLSNSYIDGI